MTVTHDFGYGPVPAHRHVNGGGWVADSASVAPTATVKRNASVEGNAVVEGNAHVGGDAIVTEHAVVRDNAVVKGAAIVGGDAHVGGNASVEGNAYVGGDASVEGNARVKGNASVADSAIVEGSRDYVVLGPLGSRDAWLTITFRPQCEITAGCWTGTPEAFAKCVREKHGASAYGQEYARALKYIRGEIAARKHEEAKP